MFFNYGVDANDDADDDDVKPGGPRPRVQGSQGPGVPRGEMMMMMGDDDNDDGGNDDGGNDEMMVVTMMMVMMM
jgi:hypothetical protein